MASLFADGALTGLFLIIAAYLLGSVSSAILVCRLMGLPDPRESGSGNPGATNVLRLGGKKAAAMTLFGDMLKGFVPAAIGGALDLPEVWIALIALAAITGHIFPVFFGFQGGKGVATGLGAILGAHLVTGLLALGIWMATSLVFRYSSLSALVAFATVPLLFLVNGKQPSAIVFLLVTLLLFWRHQDNIHRLVTGREPRLKAGKTSIAASKETSITGE